MKKLIALVFAMLFVGVGIAGATDFSLTGSYYAQGTFWDNPAGTMLASDKNSGYGEYDHEMSIDTLWTISKATKIVGRVEVRDETWGSAANATETAQGQTDDNIAVELLNASHTFGNGLTVTTGLVKTSTWSTNFGNNGTEAYRIQIAKMLPIGYWIAFTEKPQGGSEFGATDNDIDVYWSGLMAKVGDINVLPAITYVDMEPLNYTYFVLDLGLTGQMNNVGFESEFIFQDYNYEASTGDAEVWGAYVNVWTQINKFKVGAVFAYGSYDEDTARSFQFGEDFDCAGAMLIGDPEGREISMGAAADNLQAATLYAVYGSYAVNEKTTLSAYAGYASSNIDLPGNQWDEADVWEVNLQGEYKITSNVTYSAGAAYAQLEYGTSTTADPDSAVKLYHKLAFTF